MKKNLSLFITVFILSTAFSATNVKANPVPPGVHASGVPVGVHELGLVVYTGCAKFLTFCASLFD